jgi:hypothetical protein
MAMFCGYGLFGCAGSAAVAQPAVAVAAPTESRSATPTTTSVVAEIAKATIAVEVRGAVVTVAGQPVQGDQLSLRGAIARHRGVALIAEILLVDPKEEVVDELVRGAAATELKGLVFTRDGTEMAVLLAPRSRTTHEVRRTADGREHLRVVDEPPASADLATWLPGNTAEEALAGEKLRTACAANPCLVTAVRSPRDPNPPIWTFLGSWQSVARGVPALKLALTYEVTKVGTIATGRLPPEIIQRVVRENFEVFRKCYEAGLGRDAKLTGRVTVRFVIGRDGKVSNVVDGGSDIADAAVRECVLTAFYGLQFPAPEGGIVTVVYPIMLAPG